MKKYLFVLIFFLGSSAHASIMYIQADRFSCSDGKEYDVARHYIGGWGPGSWDLVAFCESGTLKSRRYNGRIISMEEAHPDVLKCCEADSAAIQTCYNEFKSLNKVSGKKSKIPRISHGTSAQDEFILDEPNSVPAR